MQVLRVRCQPHEPLLVSRALGLHKAGQLLAAGGQENALAVLHRQLCRFGHAAAMDDRVQVWSAGALVAQIGQGQFLRQRHQLLRHFRGIGVGGIHDAACLALLQQLAATLHPQPPADAGEARAVGGDDFGTVVACRADNHRLAACRQLACQGIAVAGAGKHPGGSAGQAVGGNGVGGVLPVEITARSEHPVALAAGEAVADHQRGEHVELAGAQLGQGDDFHGLAFAVGIVHDAAQGFRPLVFQHDVQNAVHAFLPLLALHVVKHHGQIRLCNMAGAAFNPLPRAQQVGQAEGGKVVRQRRAQQRGAGIGRGDAGNQLHIEAVVLAHVLVGQRGHGVNADVAAGNQRHCLAGTGFGQRQLGAVALLGERQGADVLAGNPRLDPGEVEVVGDDDVAGGQRLFHHGRDQFATAGADGD